MRTGSLIHPAVALALVLCIPAGSVGAQPPDEAEYADEYAAGSYGRVRYEENGVAILRSEAGQARDGRLAASVNMGIFPGDAVRTDATQRLEVQLAQGSLVRVDRTSELTFLSLPDPYAEFKDNTILQLAEGTVAVSAALLGDEEFRIDTPSATIYLLGEVELRVEIGPAGRTHVTSRRGVAEVVGAGGSVLVRGGMSTDVHAGLTPDEPRPHNTFDGDGFDEWIAEREAVYRDSMEYAGSTVDDEVYEELPGEIRPHYGELSANGTWVESVDYGWVWTPADVGSDWRPYHEGYWDYGPGGYFWVSSEPWGWAPYHYGRWTWIAGSGWCWIPGRVFGGAWVSWSWGPSYIGWGPRDCWGWGYGYSYHNAWIFVGYNHFYYGGHGGYHHGHYRSAGYVGDELRRQAVVTRPPSASPQEIAGSAATRDRALRDAQIDRARVSRNSVSRDRSGRFDAVERRFVSSGERSRRTAASQAVTDRRTGFQPSSTPRTDVQSRSRTPTRSYARTISGSNRSSRVHPERPVTTRTGAASRNSALPRVQTRQPESAARVRELYRDVARPRQTRAPTVSSGRSRTPSRPSASQSRSTRPRAIPGSSASPSSGGRSRSPGTTSQRRTHDVRPKSSSATSPQSRPSRSSSGSSARSSGSSSRSGSGSSARGSGGSSRSRSGSSARSSGSSSRGRSGSSARSSGSSSRSSGRGRGNR